MISTKDLFPTPILQLPSTGETNPGSPVQPCERNSATELWVERGFKAEQQGGAIRCVIPEGVIAISGDERVRDALTAIVKRLGGPPSLVVFGDVTTYFFRIDAGFPPSQALPLPVGIVCTAAGYDILVPNTDDPGHERFLASTIADLPLIPRSHEWYSYEVHDLPPEATDTPLAKLSVRGRAAEFEEAAIAPKPLLGSLCLAGQSTLIYAPPNGGKTATILKLLLEAVEAQRITPGNVYYINADDNSMGFANKLRLMDDLGVHTLCPGLNDFKAEELAGKLDAMGRSRNAANTLTIIDTSKKFVDLMHKREASRFANACRVYVMGGGTVVALAHTNKNARPDGRLVYAGTSDMLEDFDAAYLGTPLELGANGNEKVIRFEAIKRRGPAKDVVAYAFANGQCESYEQLLASVREIDPEQLDAIERREAALEDSVVIDHVAWCIENGITKKMDLAKAVAGRATIGKRAAMEVIDRYTGTDPAQHRWKYCIKERGAKVFELIDSGGSSRALG